MSARQRYVMYMERGSGLGRLALAGIRKRPLVGGFVVRKHDFESSGLTRQTPNRLRLLDELVGRREVPHDLLIEADDDPADRLADRSPALPRHAVADAAAVTSPSGRKAPGAARTPAVTSTTIDKTATTTQRYKNARRITGCYS